MIKYLDVVVLKNNIPSENLRQGAIGTVVEVLEKDVFLVEFSGKNGVAYAFATIPANQLMKVVREPLSMQA